jgi:hypothetical protein
MLKQFFATLGIIILIQPPLVWGASGSTKWPAGSKRYQTTTVVPSSLTDLLTTNAQVYQISVANTTASACTLLVKDRQASAKTILPTVSISGNTTYVISWPEGFWAPSGVQWQAGTGSCLEAQVKAAYE